MEVVLKTNTFQTWDPYPNFPSQVRVANIICNTHGLFIEVFDEEDSEVEFQIYFPAFLVYHVTSDSFRIKTISGEAAFDQLGCLYKAEDSNYIDWFHAENRGAYENLKLTHFLIATVDTWVEVLAEKPPKVIHIP